MSTATSIAARQVYGVQRVCAAWGFPRATFYAPAPLVPADGLTPAAPGKRGPKTVLDDPALLPGFAPISRPRPSSPTRSAPRCPTGTSCSPSRG